MSIQNRGLFIVIEGLDGSGKSVISTWLADVFSKTSEARVKYTYEPHDVWCAGGFIRQVLEHKITSVPPITLAFAFAANRSDHLDREILPYLLESDKNVIICHRYYLSGIAYQMSQSLPIETLLELNRFAISPDITFFLDASPTVCCERMGARNVPRELFESNLEEIRSKYKIAIDQLRKRGELIVDIDANSPLEQVKHQILKILSGKKGKLLNTHLVDKLQMLSLNFVGDF
jgi:dTMP kinase